MSQPVSRYHYPVVRQAVSCESGARGIATLNLPGEAGQGRDASRTRFREVKLHSQSRAARPAPSEIPAARTALACRRRVAEGKA